ncbi:MAG: class I SAM-dependent methyltransferase [Isosphaeraceae bacterium]
MSSQTTTPPPPLSRRVKNLGKLGLRRAFEVGQRLGVDVLPRHFYSEVPDLRTLRDGDEWKRRGSMTGVLGTDLDAQLGFIATCMTPEIRDRLAHEGASEPACEENGQPGFGPVEADVLHAFIARHRPARIVQIGCGVSTSVILRAAAETGYAPEVLCVEPYPSRFLREADADGRIRLLAQNAQTVPLEFLTELGESGLLFVDSSHAVKPGSEVNRIVLEVLPRLKTGGFVHFHDVYFPFDYQPGLLDEELFFSSESVLLQAYLTDNPRFAIAASLSMLHHGRSEALSALLPNYRPAPFEHGLRKGAGHFPTSIYLRVIN